MTASSLQQSWMKTTSCVSSGLVAAVVQLGRGTKYKRFPRWLDRWLCGRKQLGLLSFLCALLHAVYSMCLTLRRAAGYTMLNAAYRQVSSRQVNTTCMNTQQPPLTYFCGLLLLGESWCRKLLGGAAGVEVRPLPVLWNSGIWSPLSAGCYLSALCGKCSQLEGVHICSGQQINMNRSFELFLSVHQLELEASRWCEGDSSYCKRGEKN